VRLRLLGRESIREVVVVVASILIAFGLDAWWDGVSARRDSREQLAGVVRELEAGRAQLQEAVTSHQVLGGAADALRGLLVAGADGATVSVPDTLVGALFSHFVMDVSAAATLAFVDAGGLALFDRPELATALRNWPDEMADAMDDQAQLRAGVQSGYQSYMMSAAPLGNAIQAGSDMIGRSHRSLRGGPVPGFQNPPSDVALRATPELLNLLSWRVTMEDTRRRQMERLLEAQETLISGLQDLLAE
jgi:hypothetical protein